MDFKYFSTFTGIGAFEVGIQKVIPNAKCVGFSEINKWPKMMYQGHFPNHRDFGDITKINPKEIPDFDGLFGGTPCQPYSQAGKKKGFEDPRGKLFFNYVTILKQKQPKFFVMENVKRLATADKGEGLKVVLSSFIEAGYNPSFRILNANDYGIPQDRKRLFIVGIRKDLNIKFIWPEKIPLTTTFYNMLDTRNDWDPDLFWSSERVVKMVENTQNETNARTRLDMNYHQDAQRPCARTIMANIGGGYPCNVIIDRSLCKYGLWDCEYGGAGEDGFCNECVDMEYHTESYYGCPSCKKFSFMELERLFGFPKGFSDISEELNKHPTQKYRAFGNSIVVNVVEAIVIQLKELYKQNQL